MEGTEIYWMLLLEGGITKPCPTNPLEELFRGTEEAAGSKSLPILLLMGVFKLLIFLTISMDIHFLVKFPFCPITNA